MSKRKTPKADSSSAPPAPAETDFPLRLEYRLPRELAGNPHNWRKHPPAQTAAIRDFIADVGWAGAALYNEATGRLIDGQLRRDLGDGDNPEQPIPVLVGSWTEEQEKKILAGLDPLAAMAEHDNVALLKLISETTDRKGAMDDLLCKLAADATVALQKMMKKAPPNGGVGEDLEYKIMIDCTGEDQQTELLERFEAEGLDCKAMIV